jgi:hypothetical protein
VTLAFAITDIEPRAEVAACPVTLVFASASTVTVPNADVPAPGAEILTGTLP